MYYLVSCPLPLGPALINRNPQGPLTVCGISWTLPVNTLLTMHSPWQPLCFPLYSIGSLAASWYPLPLDSYYPIYSRLQYITMKPPVS